MLLPGDEIFTKQYRRSSSGCKVILPQYSIGVVSVFTKQFAKSATGCSLSFPLGVTSPVVVKLSSADDTLIRLQEDADVSSACLLPNYSDILRFKTIFYSLVNKSCNG